MRTTKTDELFTNNAPHVVTHDGHFHADDVVAFTVLQMAFTSLQLSRSRDPRVWKQANILFDVGGEYAPDRARYDHHMEPPPARANGTPYSSAGLIWRYYGRLALANLGLADGAIDWVWQETDSGLIAELDEADNFSGRMHGPGFISYIIEAFNPSWNSEATFEQRFLEASGTAKCILMRIFDQLSSEYKAQSIVDQSINISGKHGYLIITKNIPWQKNIIRGNNQHIYYVIHPDDTDTKWLVHGVPLKEGAFDVRKPLPQAWAGLEGKEFARETKLEDAVFCHPKRFLCGARSKESAVRLAEMALQA